MVSPYTSPSAPLFNYSARILCISSTSSPPSPSPSSSYPSSTPSDYRNSWNWISFIGVKNILRNQSLKAHAMNAIQGSVASPRSIMHINGEPDHLLVLVHGIMGSPSDWTYFEAQLKGQLGRNFLIYVSSSNTYTKTFTGIDGAGKRLAEEVMQVVKKTDSLKRISFLAHSLGGLFARYAAAVLYKPDMLPNQWDDVADSNCVNSKTSKHSNKGLIAGLEPIDFITLATPHLGVRGKRQLPFLLGLQFLEKLAAPIAPIFVGLTGSQLFLTDGLPNEPPLLLRMASDCEEGKFISALGAFRRRMIYANVAYDHMVGWRTSSIRRESELAKLPQMSLDGYKHVIAVEYCPPVPSEGPYFPPETAQGNEGAQNAPSTNNAIECHELMEEEMINGLQQLGWTKVDVSFHSAPWPFFAHNNINVKNEWLHNAGAEVVVHVADHIMQHEKQCGPSSFTPAGI